MTALLLDLDGTVLDTHELIFRCYCETLLEHAGVEGDRRSWQRAIGLPLADIFAGGLAAAGRAPDLVPALVEELVFAYRRRMAELESEVRPFPGMPETLAALRERGVRLCTVTTKHGSLARRHLQTTGLSRFFEAVVTGDECAQCKPHPEPFLRGLERLDVAPGEAAGVGDSAFDVVACRAAGLLAGAALWGALDVEALLAAGPDRLLRSVGELLHLE